MNRSITRFGCLAAVGYALAVCLALICYSPLGIPALLVHDSYAFSRWFTDEVLHKPGPLLLNALVVVFVVILAMRMLRPVLGHRLRRALAVVTVGMTVLCMVAATSISKYYWGYCIARPQIDPQVNAFDKVLSITEFSRFSDELTITTNFVPHQVLADARLSEEYPYYILNERILTVLEKKGILPDTPVALSPADITNMFQRAFGLMPPWQASTVVVEAIDKNGRRYVFIGSEHDLCDHRTYKEDLLSVTDGGAIQALSSKCFHYDVAGLEHLEWYLIIVPYLLVSFCLGLPLILGVHFTIYRRRKSMENSTQPAPDGDGKPAP